MRKKILAAIALLTVYLFALVITIHSGQAEQAQSATGSTDSQNRGNVQYLTATCAAVPLNPLPKPSLPPDVIPSQITLARFRQISSSTSESIEAGVVQSFEPSSRWSPREEVALAHFTNYGERYFRDLYGKPLDTDPIVVLHETVGSAQSVINYFRTPHYRDDDQVSYHAMIRRNGTIVYMVPPDKRAFGAGNSIFKAAGASESVKTNPKFPGSVNNFAYHISLETPSDGMNNYRTHSGYTRAQYDATAWLVAKTGVPNNRITTHKAVDRSRSRQDPRSFDRQYLLSLLSTYPRVSEIPIKCGAARE
jgi:hypothetical protein